MSAAPAGTGPRGYDPAEYWSRRLSRVDGLESVGWLGLGEAYNRWLYRRRAAVFWQLARAYGWARRPPSVLELGPGTGFYVERWARLGVRELTGVDVAPPAVARLGRRFPRYRFVAADIGRPLATPPGTFDVVTAFDVLFHVTEDAAFETAIAAMAGAVRPGGVALISDLFPRTREIQRAHHVSRTEAAYRAVLAAHGLMVERRLPVFVTMHPWAEPRGAVRARAARVWWGVVERAAGHVPGAGGPLGAALYAADSLLCRLVRRGPSTQVWVARRVGSGPRPGRRAGPHPRPPLPILGEGCLAGTGSPVSTRR